MAAIQNAQLLRPTQDVIDLINSTSKEHRSAAQSIFLAL
jgi:hypothetical protein